MYFCIVNDSGKNITGEFQSGNENQLTAQSILDNYCQGSNALWVKTEKVAYALQSDEHPLVDQPDLILSSRPEDKTPSTTFQLFPDYDLTSKVLYFLPKHDTSQKIPRLTIVVPQNDLSSDINQLKKIIEQSFLSPANAKEILVNDEPLTGNFTIQNVFDEAKNGKEIAVSLSFDAQCITKIRLRENLCNEIAYSENNFVNDLTIINDEWKKLFEEENMLSETDFRAIFNDIPSILKTHQQFNEIIKQHLNGYASEYSDCFIQYHPFFKVSINYITNYPNINEILKLKEENPDFQQKTQELSNRLNGRDFASYLISPVQRIPRYLLFLRELSKLTPPNHPDYLHLKKAVEVMTELTKDIDNRTETAEKQNVLYNIQLRNYTDFVYCKPSRKVIKGFDSLIRERNQEGSIIVCDDYVFIVDEHDLFCRFKAPTDAFPAEFLDDGISFRVLNTDEPDNLIQATVQLESKEALDEFRGYIKEASLKDFNSSGENESLLWEVSSLTEKAPKLCNHSGVYVKNKDEEYYLFYGGYTVKDQGNESDQVTYQRNNKIYAFTQPDQFKEIPSGIPGRYNHILIYSNNNKFFLIGGKPSSKDIFVYDNNQEGDQLGWKKINVPELDLTGHIVVQNKNNLYIYGGSPYTDNVYELNTDDYSLQTYNGEGPKPENRRDHSAVVRNNKLYIYGGTSQIGYTLSDLWCFDLETKKWENKGDYKTPRSGHQSALLGNEMVIIGGLPKGDTFTINLDTFEKKDVKDFGNYPPGLNGFSIVVGDDNTAIVYGGVESSSKVPKNTVYTVKLSENWSQKAKEEESKDSELAANKSQQNDRKPIIVTYRGVSLDGIDLPEIDDDEVAVSNSSEPNSEIQGDTSSSPQVGNGDEMPWTLSPEQYEELLNSQKENEGNQFEANPENKEEQPEVQSKEVVDIGNGELAEPETATENKAENAENEGENGNNEVPNTTNGEPGNGDEMPWTLSPEQYEELLNSQKENEGNQFETNPEDKEEQPEVKSKDVVDADNGELAEPETAAESKTENAENEGENAENEAANTTNGEPGNGDEMPWTLSPEEGEELIRKSQEEAGNNEAPQQQTNEEEAAHEEDKTNNEDWIVDENEANKNKENENDELDQGGNQFEPDQNRDVNNEEEETLGNQFEPDQNRDVNNEEEETLGNQFEPDQEVDNENANKFEEEEEVPSEKQKEEEENASQKQNPEEEENGQQQEQNPEGEEKQQQVQNPEEEEKVENQQQNPEEEENGQQRQNPEEEENGQQQQNPEEEENGQQQQNPEEEEKVENQQQQQQQQEKPQNKQDKQNEEEASNSKHSSKKYEFDYTYKPSEEEETESTQDTTPEKKKTQWPFEEPDDPPRKLDPIFYPETPRRRKKTQPKKKNNSQLTPTAGASGKPPIFSYSKNYDYYQNYNNGSLNNNSLSGYDTFSPFSPKRQAYTQPKSSLYPNILDDVTPRKKMQDQQEKLKQEKLQQRLQQRKVQQPQQNSSQFNSSLSSSSMLQNRRSQQNQPSRNSKTANRDVKSPTQKVWKVTPSRNIRDEEEEQSRQQDASDTQTSSLINSSSEEIQIKVQRTQKNKLELSPVSAKEEPGSDFSSNKLSSQASRSDASRSAASKSAASRSAASKSAAGKSAASISAASISAASGSAAGKSDASKSAAEKSDASKSAALKSAASRSVSSKKSGNKEELEKNISEESAPTEVDVATETDIEDKEIKSIKEISEEHEEKDKKKDDKKKDKKKDKRNGKDDDDEDKKKDKKKKREKDISDEKEDKKKKSKKNKENDEEEKKHHHNNKSHKSDHAHYSSKVHSPRSGRYDVDQDANKNSGNRQNRSDINSMTKTNDTMPLMFDTSPIRKPNEETQNKQQQPQTNPYYNNNTNNSNYAKTDRFLRRKRFDNRDVDFEENEDGESGFNGSTRKGAPVSFKHKPSFKRTARNHFNFNDFEQSGNSNNSNDDFGMNKYDFEFNQNFDDSEEGFGANNYGNDRYFNFRIQGGKANNNTTNSNSVFKGNYRKNPPTIMTTFNIQKEGLNCAYLPKRNMYGVPYNFNNNNDKANVNPYVSQRYVPTNYRNDHARSNNKRYNYFDSDESFNPFSSS